MSPAVRMVVNERSALHPYATSRIGSESSVPTPRVDNLGPPHAASASAAAHSTKAESLAVGTSLERRGTAHFDALYEAHFEFVWRTLRRFGVPASVAEDAAQDVFVVLHRKLPELRPDASAKAYLFSIARRVASDYRRSARVPPASLDAERTESTDRGPFDRAADREAGEALEAFLESLDEDKRVAFMLVELEGLTMPEVSQLLATNINTLYSRVRAARAQLMELLASQGGRHG
jgi:RNA polymerase sigma-70 factor (ECF subfamily)